MSSNIDIKLKRSHKVYKPHESIEGKVVIDAFKGWAHNGIQMHISGSVHLTNNKKAAVLVDSSNIDSSNGCTLVLIDQLFEISTGGRFSEGLTEIPFVFNLSELDGRCSLIETYHGVYISVLYYLNVVCDRGVMKNKLQRKIEFIIEIPSQTKQLRPPVLFSITPQTLENLKPIELSKVPNFIISGKLDSSTYAINTPFSGEIIIELSESPIKSIELQLVRVETVDLDDNSSTALFHEATEIQNIQIADGDVCRKLHIPMFMRFPKIFSCVTTIHKKFRIEFEVIIMVIFSNGYMVTEYFPLELYRVS